MQLTDLPPELFTRIFGAFVDMYGIENACYTRGTCKTYDRYIMDEIITNQYIEKLTGDFWAFEQIFFKYNRKRILQRRVALPHKPKETLVVFVKSAVEALLAIAPERFDIEATRVCYQNRLISYIVGRENLFEVTDIWSSDKTRIAISTHPSVGATVAAACDDLIAVQHYLAKGSGCSNDNSLNEYNTLCLGSPLAAAAASGSEIVLRHFLDDLTLANEVERWKTTIWKAVTQAVIYNQPGTLGILLQHPLYCRDYNDFAHLIEKAAQMSSIPVLSMLFDFGRKTYPEKEPDDALRYAYTGACEGTDAVGWYKQSTADQLETLRWLFTSHLPSTWPEHVTRPSDRIYTAVRSQNLDIVRYLLQQLGAIQARYAMQVTLLTHKLSMVKLLMDREIPITQTALDLASEDLGSILDDGNLHRRTYEIMFYYTIAKDFVQIVKDTEDLEMPRAIFEFQEFVERNDPWTWIAKERGLLS